MLENEVAQVTGASRGIGRAIAAAGVEGRGIVLDVSSAGSVEQCFKDVEAREGTPTVLVNNAGVTHDGLLMRMSADDWQTVIETDLSSATGPARRSCAA